MRMAQGTLLRQPVTGFQACAGMRHNLMAMAYHWMIMDGQEMQCCHYSLLDLSSLPVSHVRDCSSE